jgi:carboxymethylenebutenolidase
MTIQQQTVDLETATGTMRCRVFRPTNAGAFPSILFYSEIFQITSPITRTAAYIAGHGYVVIVPEVFHELNTIGTVLAYDDAGKDKGNDDKFAKALTSHDSDTLSMVDWVDEQEFCNGSLGTFGVCLGGHLAFRAALHPRVQAASCLYATDIHSSTMPAGSGTQTIDRLKDATGEMLMIWGKQDPHVPLEGRKLLYDRLTEDDVNFSWHEFNAQHAFIRDEGDRYDPEIATLCYQLTMDLFHRALR